MKFQTYVCAASVLCLGGISTVPIQAWKDKIKWYLETRYLKDLDRIDEEPMEFQWKIFPGFTTSRILDEVQKMMAELRCEPEQFQGRVIFMSMYNDIVWRERGCRENCVGNSVNVAAYAKKFPQGCWSFLGPGCEKKWYGTHVSKPDGEWYKTAEVMLLNFAESRAHRGELKSIVEGKKSIHFNGSEETVELINILRTVYFCQSAQYPRSSLRFVQRLTPRLKKTNRRWGLGIYGGTDRISQCWCHLSDFNIIGTGNLLQEYEHKFAELSDDQKLSKLCMKLVS